MATARLARSECQRRSALALILLAGGCQEPVGVKAFPGESSSTEPNESATTSAATANTSTTSADGSDPSRPPSPPFELPEGCGDGVIVSGQYDCFLPVPLDWVEEELGGSVELRPLDVYGDSQTEVIALNKGARIAVLQWENGELSLGPSVNSQSGAGSYSIVQTRWDWNGDGRRDVTILPQTSGRVAVHLNMGIDGLGEEVVQHELAPLDKSTGTWGSSGHAAPIDVDGDGVLEVLVSLIVAEPKDANPVEDLTLFRRSGNTWNPVGNAYHFPACGWLHAVAYGDFDGDTDDDIAVLDHGQACDPFPSSYDPDWYRVGILLSDSEAGVLQLGGWYPIGAVVSDPKIWTEDVDADERLDLIIQVSDPIYGVAVMIGRGDGSFEQGNVIDLRPALPQYELISAMDADGDGTREWIASLSEGQPWTIPFDFSVAGIAPLVGLNDTDAGGTTRFKEPIGDVNGDSVDDYRVRAAYGPYQGEFLMVSAP